MKEMLQVRGVGPAMARAMADVGITSPHALATAEPETLTALPRVRLIRARMLIAAAQDALSAVEAQEDRVAVAGAVDRAQALPADDAADATKKTKAKTAKTKPTKPAKAKAKAAKPSKKAEKAAKADEAAPKNKDEAAPKKKKAKADAAVPKKKAKSDKPKKKARKG